MLSSRLCPGQDTQFFVSGPTNPVAVGAVFRLNLFLLSTSSDARTERFPAELTARVQSGQTTAPCQLRLAGADQDAEVRLVPGGFARREYTGELPSLPAGPATLQITSLPANPLSLVVAASSTATASAPDASAPRPEKAAAAPSREAFDPVDFFNKHFSAYDPIYFIAGPDSPNGKFQYSFKYKLIEPGTNANSAGALLGNAYFAFTQTSLWDLSSPSSPFLDSSYMPEAFYLQPETLQHPPGWFSLGFQTGFKHESNGRDGDDSRSLNQVYLEPLLRFGQPTNYHLTLAPRAWFYVGGLEDNPDLARYRGYCGLRATLGKPNGLQIGSTLRVGDTGERASLLVDVSHPIWVKGFGIPWYAYFQYFLGYGESLLHYQERESVFRIGLAIYR